MPVSSTSGSAWANQVPDPDQIPGQKTMTQTSGTESGKAVHGAAATSDVDTAAIVLDKVKKPMDGAADVVLNKNGAPTIDGPIQEFSASDMVELLRELKSKSQDGQLKNAQETVRTTGIQTEKNNEAQLQSTKDWVKKCDEAKNQGFFAKLFGWIAKIAAVILSAVMIVGVLAGAIGTGGAAAPLLAVGILAFVAATSSLADQISKETGGEGFSIANLLVQGASKLLQAFGMDEEKANNIGKIIAGAAAIAIPGGLALVMVDPSLFGLMTEGIMNEAKVDPKTTAYVVMAVTMVTTIAVAVATTVMTGGTGAATAMARALKIGEALVQGTNAIVQGASGIAVGMTQSEADNLQAQKKELQALSMKLQQRMADGVEDLKRVIQEIDDGIQAVTKVINGISDSMSQVIGNMGGKVSA